MDKPDFLELIDGQRLRVEVNMLSLGEAVDRLGMQIHEISNHEGDPKVITELAHCCIQEGERLDGKEFTMTLQELRALMRVPQLFQFKQIFQAQSLSTGKKKEPELAKTRKAK